MSRIFEALKQSTAEGSAGSLAAPELADNVAAPEQFESVATSGELDGCRQFAVRGALQSRLISLSDERSIGAEKIRVIATRLRHLHKKKAFSTVLITSSMKGEGKSVMTANLAITFASQVRHPTLLVDCDFRCPTQHSLFGLEPSPGTGEWWEDDLPLNQAIRKHEELPLWVLPAGAMPDQPLSILQSQKFADLIAKLGTMFKWVFIDSPPLLPMADSSVLSHLAEGVVMVVRQGITPTKLLNSAIESLDRKKLLGVIVNESSASEQRYYDSYYK